MSKKTPNCAQKLRNVPKRHRKCKKQCRSDHDLEKQTLLFGTCDSQNSEYIVNELLSYLQVADYDIQDELVLKIAILRREPWSSD